MGAWMIIKVSLPNKNVVEFLERNNTDMIISYIDNDEGPNGTAELFFKNYYGYAEPCEMYEEYQDIVNDIWWLDISTVASLLGKNMNTKWYSSKKEWKQFGT